MSAPAPAGRRSASWCRFAATAPTPRARRASLARLERRADDELIVADNTEAGIAASALADVATVVPATGERSSYHARNAGAAAARAEWLLFIDADCVPVADLLDRYFAAPIGDRCGAVAGAIRGVSEQRGLLARYARDRNFLDQSEGLHGSSGVAAATGNLLVRQATFDRLGGFEEGIRSAGDVDFCWRMHRAGWTLEQRPEAMVEHHHREDLASFLAMIARYGAGARWLNERHPGVAPRWPLLGGLGGAARDVGGVAGARAARAGGVSGHRRARPGRPQPRLPGPEPASLSAVRAAVPSGRLPSLARRGWRTSISPALVLLWLWAFGLAGIEIEIEGGRGWAERLPTWYLKRGRVGRVYGVVMGPGR